MTRQTTPIFWSFRRCPYAMRARLALKASGIEVRLREIILRDKPEQFLQASDKGTVPVLVKEDGSVIDESLDIMLWALERADPQGWLTILRDDEPLVRAHLDAVDHDFKHHLDRYKYATRYEDSDAVKQRQAGVVYLEKWNDMLGAQTALSGSALGLLDYATLPFVRQFRIADKDWFDAQPWPHLHGWLHDFLESAAFAAIMRKYKPWNETGEEIAF